MLIILDGFGFSKNSLGNAIFYAKMPVWRMFLDRYPSKLLNASGTAVGLLDGFIGNSEVGHKTIGAGRIIKSSLKKIHENIHDGSFFTNPILVNKFQQITDGGKSLHLMGLLSDGGVHSHEYQLHALIKLAHQIGLTKVYIHAFLDGRDVPPQSAQTYLERLDKVFSDIGCGKLASLHGRFYAMDRDNNWDRTKISYDVLTQSSQNVPAQFWKSALENSYTQNITDEFFYPTMLNPAGTIQPGDGVVFFNFRPDRARQLTESFINPSFNHFPVKDLASNLTFFTTFTRYKAEFAQFNNDILYEEEQIDHTLLDEIASQKKSGNNRVFIIAETEKYAHVTYFFRGMIDKQLPNETRILIPSLKERNYIKHPEMAAQEITTHLIQSLQQNPAYFYLVNYANADMVGHTGNFDATVKACEILDAQIKKLYEEVVERLDGTLFITADHGNAEEQLDASGKPRTAHTQNPVPFVVIKKGITRLHSTTFKKNLGLANIAATILQSMNLAIPAQMNSEAIFPKEIFMAHQPTRNERIWASAVHMPTLTIIWTAYFGYYALLSDAFFGFLRQSLFALDKIPVTPLIFTGISIVISQVIYMLNTRSAYVQDQALEAYKFNKSLLRWYGFGFLGGMLGHWLHMPILSSLFLGLMTATSINCLIQAFLGVATTMRGEQYRYWYWFKK